MRTFLSVRFINRLLLRRRRFGLRSHGPQAADMLLHVFFVLVGLSCHGFSVSPPSLTVLQNTNAVLSCPDRNKDVTWSRFINGEKVTLVTIKDEEEKIFDKHFGSLVDNSLVIIGVKLNDSGMYFCNGKQIYLNVTTDPNKVTPKRNESAPPRNSGPDSGLGPDQNGSGAAGGSEPEDQRSSDLWKIAVGGVVGPALVLLVVLTLRLCSETRGEANLNVSRTVTRVIYEEVEEEEQPRRESELQSPSCCWKSSCTTQNNNLHNRVHRLKTSRCSTEECVSVCHYVGQSPAQTADVSQYSVC